MAHRVHDCAIFRGQNRVLCARRRLLYVAGQFGNVGRKPMRTKLATGAFAALAVFAWASAAAAAKLTIAVGGAGCLCYLPTVLAQQLGEYKKEGLDVELVNFKGGSQALTAV